VQNMADNHKDDLLILQYLANKALQKTQTALGSFSILLSHNGLLPVHGSLPVARARFGLLSAGVRRALAPLAPAEWARDSIEPF
jgi:hypothetical protein